MGHEAAEIKIDEHSLLPEDVQQTYVVEPGQKRQLECWKDMLSKGQISSEQLAEMEDEPWFEQEVLNFEGLEGLDEMRELLKTPAQRRIELGIDQHLTSQKQNLEKVQQKKRTRQLRKQLRQPLRAEVLKKMRSLKDQGYSVDDISAHIIRPSVGKGKKVFNKKTFRDSVVAKMQKKAQAKAKAKPKDDAEQVASADQQNEGGGKGENSKSV